MAPTTLSEPSWSQQIYAAYNMLENDKQNCIPILQAVLDQSCVPRYWRIQALIALASAVNDWYEAEEYRQEADILWRSTRILFPKWHDRDMDRLLAGTRVLLDHLALDLDDTMPDSIRALRAEAAAEDEQATDDEDPDTSDDDDDDDDNPGDDESDDGWDTDGSQDDEDETGP